MEIKRDEQKRCMVLSKENGESFELSFLDFWQVVKFGELMDTRDEVENFLSDLDEINGVDVDFILGNKSLVDVIAEKTISLRIERESSDQIWAAAKEIIKQQEIETDYGFDRDEIPEEYMDIDRLMLYEIDEINVRLSDGRALNIHECDEGYDWTLYNPDFTIIDGGQYDDYIDLRELYDDLAAEFSFEDQRVLYVEEEFEENYIQELGANEFRDAPYISAEDMLVKTGTSINIRIEDGRHVNIFDSGNIGIFWSVYGEDYARIKNGFYKNGEINIKDVFKYLAREFGFSGQAVQIRDEDFAVKSAENKRLESRISKIKNTTNEAPVIVKYEEKVK